MDYFDSPICPNCFAILAEDGTHWAAETVLCPNLSREAARLRGDREREFHRSQPIYDPVED